MVGITAEQAREMAIGAESTAVANFLTKCEGRIEHEAKRGALNEHVCVDSGVTNAVRMRVINILTSRGFEIVNHPTAIEIGWGE